MIENKRKIVSRLRCDKDLCDRDMNIEHLAESHVALKFTYKIANNNDNHVEKKK